MTTSRPDWEEELIHDPEEEYKALLRALRRTQGFGLLFVECSPAEGNRLIQKVRADLPHKTIEVLTFEEPLKDGNVYRRVKQKLAENPVEVLFIQGLEHSLYDYEDTKRHLGWSSEEIYSYSWRGVPPVMVNLNQQRENFRDHFNTCFVFLIPVFVTKYMIHRAPDFFDWRSGIFHFPMAGYQLQQATRLVYMEERNEEAFRKLAPHERRKRILQIQSLLDEEGLSSEEKANLLFEQALLFSYVNELEAAIASYDKLLELKSDYYDAWYNRGLVLSDLGRKQEAIASYDKAIEFKSDDHKAWNNRGIALDNLGQEEEAITSYDKAIKIKPDAYQAWNNRGIALSALGRTEESIASYNKALEIKPDDASTYFNKACWYALWGKVDNVIQSLQKAIELDPQCREKAKTDTDFDNIREDERFRALVEAEE